MLRRIALLVHILAWTTAITAQGLIIIAQVAIAILNVVQRVATNACNATHPRPLVQSRLAVKNGGFTPKPKGVQRPTITIQDTPDTPKASSVEERLFGHKKVERTVGSWGPLPARQEEAAMGPIPW